jgi:hypothetical protein
MSGVRATTSREPGRRDAMQRILKIVLPALVITAAMMATDCSAQSASEQPKSMPQSSALEIAFTYQGTHSDVVNGSGFWMQGGTAQIHGQFYGGWGAVADIAGAHITNINSSRVTPGNRLTAPIVFTARDCWARHGV